MQRDFFPATNTRLKNREEISQHSTWCSMFQRCFLGLNLMALVLPRHLDWYRPETFPRIWGLGRWMSQERRANNVEHGQNVARLQPRLVIPARQTRMFLRSLECTVSPASSGPINQGQGDRLSGRAFAFFPPAVARMLVLQVTIPVESARGNLPLWHIGDAT
jgi:hypothetical protein